MLRQTNNSYDKHADAHRHEQDDNGNNDANDDGNDAGNDANDHKAVTRKDAADHDATRRPKYFFAYLNGTYRVMRASNLDAIFMAWMRALLRDEHADKLLSITRGESEISMIVTSDLPLPDCDAAGLGDAGTYYAMQVFTDQPGLYETDILAPITAFFADANIAILCVSTFNYNYLLIPVHERDAFERAVRENDDVALEEHGLTYEYPC